MKGLGQICGPRQVRPLTTRTTHARSARKRLCTDATLARDTPESALPQRLDSEALLLRRYKAHDAAVTATLVLDDKGRPRLLAVAIVTRASLNDVYLMQLSHLVAGDTKEVVTASLDKSLALWRLQVRILLAFSRTTLLCYGQASNQCCVVTRTPPCQIPSQAPVDWLRLSGLRQKLVLYSALSLTPLPLVTTTTRYFVAIWLRALRHGSLQTTI